jgi:hypothetical protein
VQEPAIGFEFYELEKFLVSIYIKAGRISCRLLCIIPAPEARLVKQNIFQLKA